MSDGACLLRWGERGLPRRFVGENCVTDLVHVVQTSVQTYDAGLTQYLDFLGLPAAKVLATIDDRRKVITVLPSAIERLGADKRSEAYYISKMAAACCAGLFDAGLNYLWDAVVASLRERVTRFDLEYFFSNAVPTSERKDFQTADDLKNLDDYKLIKGCHDCGLLSDVAHKTLDHIRDMRNWASAAHPNNAELGGIQLMGFLESCVKEVFSVEPTGYALAAQRLLRNLREQTLSAADVAPIAKSISELPSDVTTAILRAVAGLYSDPRLDRRVVNNIQLIAKALWAASPDKARYEVGVRYGTHAVNAEIDRKERLREFLDLVGGLGYLTEDQRTIEIAEKAAQLESAHFGWDNFANEVPIARALSKLVPPDGSIPAAVNDAYVRAVVLPKIGRPSGVSNGAEPSYDAMINLFTDSQIKAFLLLPNTQQVGNRLQNLNLGARFSSIASTLAGRTANRTIQTALTYITGRTPPQIAGLSLDSQYQRILGDVL